MEDVAAGSVEEMAADAYSRAPAFAATVDHFGVDSSQVDAYADLGVRFSANYVSTPAELAELRRWREIGPDARRNAVLMDNTTITAAAGLLNAGSDTPVTALTLWDLARFVDAVVAYDRIHHFENPAVEDRAINALLATPAMSPVAFPTTFSNNPVGGLVVHAWQTTTSVMRDLVTGSGGPGRMIDDLVAAWSAVVGQQLTATDIIDPQYVWDVFNSPSDALLAELAELTRGVPVSGLDADVRRGGRFRRQALIECNYRGHVTQQLANALDLPYRPSIARVPFRRLDRWLPRAVDDQLHSIAYADDAYAERLATVGRLPRLRIRLPVLLAVLLRRSPDRSSLWAELARLRAEAAGYRGLRAELDDALAIGDEAVIHKVLKATTAEMTRLGDRFAANRASVEESAATMAEAMTTAASNPIGLIGPALTGLFAAARVLLPAEVGHRIVWRLTRPQYRFLSDVRAESRGITAAMPRIQKLWLIPDGEAEVLAERFAGFATLAADH